MWKNLILRSCLLWIIICTFPHPCWSGEQGQDSDRKSYNLDDVVVTATRTEREIGNVPASISVIDSATIEQSPAQRLEDILATIPGIDQQGQYTFGRGRSSIYMRGINDMGKVLVMVDGIPINSSYGGTVEWNMIPMENIQRIEVVRGPASSLYGSYAMAGVINIITKKPESGHEVKLAQSYGSMETWTSSVCAQGRGKKLGYRLNGRYKTSEGYYSHRPQEPWDIKSDFEIKNADGDLYFFQDEDSSLKLGFSYYERNFGRGYVSNDIERDAQKANLIYERNAGKIDWRAAAYYYREFQYVNFSGSSPPYETVVQNEEHTWPLYGAMLQSAISLRDWNTLTLGAEYKHSSIEGKGFNYINEPGRYNITEGNQEYFSLYLQEEMSFFNEDFIVNLGARQDWWRSYGGMHYDNVLTENNIEYDDRRWEAFNPKLGLLYHLTADTSVRAAVARGYTAPPINQQYLVLPRRNIVMRGNPDLDPELLMSYEAGLEHFFTPGLSLGLTFYHSDGEDFIGSRYEDATTMRYDNISKVQMRGIEAELKYRINREWLARLNYTYNESTIEEDPTDPETEGEYFPYTPKNKGNLSLAYDNPDLLTARITLKYVGIRYTDVPNDDARELGAYTTMDLYVAKTFGNRIKLYLACDDLFDRQPVELVWANKFTGESDDVVTAGRVLTAGVEVTF